MRAIEYMLEQKLWGNLYGKIQNIRNVLGIPRSVTPEEFTTNVCHCGFCTITLQALGLPLGKPTKGNYNLAINYNYPLPRQLHQYPFVFVRYQQKGIYEYRFLKQSLNPFIGNEQKEWVLKIHDQLYVDDYGEVNQLNNRLIVDWSSDIITRNSIITAIWTQIWRCLYEINR